MKSSLIKILIFLYLQILISSAVILTQENTAGILTPENAVCLTPGNLGPEKKFESAFTSAFVAPQNLNDSVDLGRQLEPF